MLDNLHDGRTGDNETSAFDAEVLQEYYPKILDKANIGIWILNADMKTVFANESMAELLNTTVADLLQQPVNNFIFTEDENSENILTLLKKVHGPYSAPCRYKSSDGVERWLRVESIPINTDGAEKNNHQFLAVHTRYNAEASPANGSQGIGDQVVLKSVKDYAVMTVDINRTILSWNSGANNIFGYTEKEVTGRSADILFTPEDNVAGAPEQEVSTALTVGHSYDDRWHLRKDGSRFFASGVMTRLANEGQSPRFIKIARDWTERKKVEEMLKNADRHKNEFLATLAHELRNPLASILSGIEVLKDDKDNVIIKKTRDVIERQVQQMIHLVNDLLDISRISLGKIKLKKENINLIDVIHMALDTSRSIIEGYKHALTVSLPSGPVVVHGDAIRLSQAFLNLLINSAKYTPQKGKITLGVYPQDENVVIKISDNGMGIPPQMLSSIFEMFEQIQDRSEYPQAGLGIGLSVVKQFVEMHNGTVQAYSAGVNMGCEFTVTLPTLSNEELGHQETSPLLSIPVKQQPKLAKKRLLLVDDNKDAADMMEILLKKKGYTIRKAYDGKTAIKTAMDFDPEIVILDLGLPDINGYEVLENLQGKPGTRHYIALSGWGQDEDLRKSKEAGFDYHLVKPLDIQSLEDILQTIA